MAPFSTSRQPRRRAILFTKQNSPSCAQACAGYSTEATRVTKRRKPMPNYSQYNTNAQPLLDSHVAIYMAWYHVAIVLYVLGAAAFLAYWFFRNRATVIGGVAFSIAGLGCQAASLGLRWS